ncbi:hypothetical protein BVJ53_09675 [Lacticaseibacillus chiayiensis]|uniref:Uncharacterized protein n=1 Tax=Lacticaseibacillus chiayiensis TaxID=2100821 RepID=A0A4Q1TQ17_9LACO|nr:MULTISPECIES: hypothetical protein [Lacticaseibacillus]QVI34223.1 hypothetical protein KG086_10555 [Lacticaseibacillus chiayiensis]RXT20849.1 hypothetical protein BVJ53_09675 [Lacticaseibacillus chiayiensis]RXT55328.1 hypothetical protein CHT97_12575 [Lacticaseibacillus chiayiensis]TLQ49659.1 hypothetical protein FEZ34_14310 [Lacticaseibacillus casei]UYN56001.1 hypothetical protein OFW50_11025 [Lacticaseibacillus chiayiensis]
MNTEFGQLSAKNLAEVMGGRKIVGWTYQTGMGQVPIYDTDIKRNDIVVPNFFRGVIDTLNPFS